VPSACQLLPLLELPLLLAYLCISAPRLCASCASCASCVSCACQQLQRCHKHSISSLADAHARAHTRTHPPYTPEATYATACTRTHTHAPPLLQHPHSPPPPPPQPPLNLHRHTTVGIRVVFPRKGSGSNTVRITGASSRSVESARTRIELIVDSATRSARPSHFLCVPLIGPAFDEAIARFSERGVELAPGIDPAMVTDPASLHLTLGTLKLFTDSAVRDAKALLQRCVRPGISVHYMQHARCTSGCLLRTRVSNTAANTVLGLATSMATQYAGFLQLLAGLKRPAFRPLCTTR
jgi:hypothetical protein